MHHEPNNPLPIDFQLTEMEGVSSEAVLTVNEVAPFSILHASQDWLDLFRFSKDEVVGRSVRVINGPSTDMSLLQNMIQTTAEEKHKSAVITLYSSSGCGHVMVVKTFKQFGFCNLTMTASDAIPSQQVTMRVNTARTIVTTEPYYVQQISPKFSKMFGLSEQEIVGRTIRMLDGPHTDILAFQQLLTKAKTGFSQRGTMVAFTKDCMELTCHVELVPVVGPGGVISHLQIDFTTQGTNVEYNFQNHFEEWQTEEPPSSSYGPRAAPQWQPPRQADPGFAQLPPVQIGFPQIAAPSAFPLAQPSSHMLPPAAQRASSVPGCWQPGHRQLKPGSASEPASHQHLASAPSVRDHQQDFEAMTLSQVGRPPHFNQPEAGPSRTASTQSELSQSTARLTLAHASWASSSRSESTPGPAAAETQRRRGRGGNRSALRLFPRRKAGESDLKALGGPVDLSKEVVNEFVGMSMKEASQKLGISASAMKKACRKLGIQKWPHKSVRSSVDFTTYNSAYVRRLYSKYAEKPEGGPCDEIVLASGGRDGPEQPQPEDHDPHSPSDISDGSQGDEMSEMSPCGTPRHGHHGPGHGPVYHHDHGYGQPEHHDDMHRGASDGATPSIVWENWGREQGPTASSGGVPRQ